MSFRKKLWFEAMRQLTLAVALSTLILLPLGSMAAYHEKPELIQSKEQVTPIHVAKEEAFIIANGDSNMVREEKKYSDHQGGEPQTEAEASAKSMMRRKKAKRNAQITDDSRGYLDIDVVDDALI